MNPRSHLENALTRLRVDSTTAGDPPSWPRVAVGTVLAVVVSLAADFGVVKWAAAALPSIKDYPHFEFVDYGTLTIVGVVGAGAAWFVVTRVTSSPRWLFLRLALVVTLVLWIPDVYLLVRREPTGAVLFLMLMHVLIAVVTYNALVRLAPVESDGARRGTGVDVSIERSVISRRAWTTMMMLVGAEMLIGFGELLAVPFDRPNGWVISQGEAVTLIHGALGGLIGLGAVAIYALASRAERIERIAATVGLCGVGVGGVGGFFCYAHSLRLIGMVLMFFGAATAFFGYLMPTIDDVPDTEHFRPPGFPPSQR
ncbi:MAG: hypothetical protein WAN30_06375 [Acidimicrobiales bacterium]